jgi:hypothetical protein
MWLQSVKSRAIAKWGYDGFRKLLVVVFTPGSIYVYYGVPAEVFEEAKAAESKGAWFNQSFKSRFFDYDEIYRPPGLRPPKPVLFHGVSKFFGPWFENWQH